MSKHRRWQRCQEQRCPEHPADAQVGNPGAQCAVGNPSAPSILSRPGGLIAPDWAGAPGGRSPGPEVQWTSCKHR
eukprot:3836479-Alexandrium_andersonii.AAC.1